MTGLVRKATLLSVCGLLIAGTAMAFVPSPVTSSVPCAISLVGRSGVTADVVGQFNIVVKDIAGNTIPNAALVFDFTGCCSDIRLSEVQNNCGTCQAASIDGTHKKINVTCDGNGAASIRIQGVARKVGPLAGTIGCASLTANGQLLTDGTNKPLIAVSVYDLDGGAGSLGLGNGDLSSWLSDFFGGTYFQKDDYDRSVACAAAVGNPDLSKWLSAFFAAGSASNDAPFGTTCP